MQKNLGTVTMTSGDFNGDGKTDLATYGVIVRLGRGDGTFGRAVDVNVGNDYEYWFVAADLNADGHLDLAGVEGNNVFVLLNAAPDAGCAP